MNLRANDLYVSLISFDNGKTHRVALSAKPHEDIVRVIDADQARALADRLIATASEIDTESFDRRTDVMQLRVRVLEEWLDDTPEDHLPAMRADHEAERAKLQAELDERNLKAFVDEPYHPDGTPTPEELDR